MIERFIGIDPGKGGGVAILCRDNSITARVMPVSGSRIDISRLKEWLELYTGKYHTIACLEKVGAMRKGPKGIVQGTVSTYTFGFGTGSIYGMLITMGISIYEPAPQTWKKLILVDTPKDKQAAIDYCIRTYPKMSLLATTRSKKPHTGMADAICIARYAYERYKTI